MDAHSVLTTLRDRGIVCRIKGDRFICSPSEKLDDPLREAIRQHKPDLLRLVVRWQALADAQPPVETADAWPEECFLISCSLFRDADSREQLLARWAGLRKWLSGELPPEAMLVLARLVDSLKTRHAQ